MSKQSKFSQIPKASAGDSRQLQRFIDVVTRNINTMTGSSNDSVLTQRNYKDLQTRTSALSKQISGLSDHLTGIDGQLNGGKVEFPTIPTGLIGNAALTNIMLTWDPPSYLGHAYTEILFNPEDLLAEAKPIGTAPYPIFIHPVALLSKGYYWVRHVNRKEQKGPVNSSEGMYIEASQSPADLLKILSDAIADDGFLSDDVLSRIDLIDTTKIGEHYGLINIAQALANADQVIENAQAVLNSTVNSLDEYIKGVGGIEPRLAATESANALLESGQQNLTQSLNSLDEFIQGDGGLAQTVLDIERIQGDTVTVVEGVKSQQTQLSTSVASLQQASAESATRLESVEFESNNQKSQIVSLQSANAEQAEQISSLQVQTEQQAASLTHIQTVNSGLVSEVSDLRLAQNGIAGRVLTVEQVNNEMVQRVGTIEIKQEETTSTIHSLSQASLSQAQVIDTLLIDGEQFTSQINQIQTVSAGLARDLEHLEIEQNGVKGRITTVEEVNEQVVSRVATLEFKDTQIDSSISSLSQANSEFAQQLDLLSYTSSNHTATITQLQTVTETLSQNVESMTLTQEGMQSKITSVEQLSNDTASRVGTIEFKQENLTASVTTLEQASENVAARTSIIEHKQGEQSAQLVELETAALGSAERIEQLGVEVGEKTTAVEVKAKAYTDDVTGALRAERVIKVDANGVVAGFGLLADSENGSKIYLSADQIAFVPPNWQPEHAYKTLLPFIYSAEHNRVVINKASIVDLTADKIVGGNLVVDDFASLAGFQVRPGAIKRHMLDPEITQNVVRIDPDAEKLGGSVSVTKKFPSINDHMYTSRLKSGGQKIKVHVNIASPRIRSRGEWIKFALWVGIVGENGRESIRQTQIISGTRVLKLLPEGEQTNTETTVFAKKNPDSTYQFGYTQEFIFDENLPEQEYRFYLTKVLYSNNGTNLNDVLFTLLIDEPLKSSGGIIADIHWKNVIGAPKLAEKDKSNEFTATQIMPSLLLKNNGAVRIGDNQNPILKNSGSNTEVNANGKALLLGHQKTEEIHLKAPLKNSGGTQPIIDTNGRLYDEGRRLSEIYMPKHQLSEIQFYLTQTATWTYLADAYIPTHHTNLVRVVVLDGLGDEELAHQSVEVILNPELGVLSANVTDDKSNSTDIPLVIEVEGEGTATLVLIARRGARVSRETFHVDTLGKEAADDIRDRFDDLDELANAQIEQLLGTEVNFQNNFTKVLTLTEKTKKTRADLLDAVSAQADENQAIAERISIVRAEVDGNKSEILSVAQSIVDAEQSMAQQLIQLTSVVDENYADIVSHFITKVDAESAISQTKQELTSKFEENASQIVSVSKALADSEQALTLDISTLRSQVGDNYSDITTRFITKTDANAAISEAKQEFNTRFELNEANLVENYYSSADTDEAISAASTVLEAKVDGKIGAVSDRLDTVKSTADGNSSAISQLTLRANSLDQSMSAAFNRIYNVEVDADNNSSAISAMFTRANDIENGLDAVSGRVSQVETKANGTASAVESLSTRVSSTEHGVSSANIELSSHASRLGGLESRVSLSVTYNGLITGLDITPGKMAFAADAFEWHTSSSHVIRSRNGGMAGYTNGNYQWSIGSEGNAHMNYVHADNMTLGSDNSKVSVAADIKGIYTGVRSSASNWAFYAQQGAIGPHTSAHEGLLPKEIAPEVGDIVCDVELIHIADISNAIGTLRLSNQCLDGDVRGVYTARRPLEIDQPAGLKGLEGWERLAYQYDIAIFNAGGEGAINVCSEGGDLKTNDYICASSIPGKGMRLPDDAPISKAVAQNRFPITFPKDGEIHFARAAAIYIKG